MCSVLQVNGSPPPVLNQGCRVTGHIGVSRVHSDSSAKCGRYGFCLAGPAWREQTGSRVGPAFGSIHPFLTVCGQHGWAARLIARSDNQGLTKKADALFVHGLSQGSLLDWKLLSKPLREDTRHFALVSCRGGSPVGPNSSNRSSNSKPAIIS